MHKPNWKPINGHPSLQYATLSEPGNILVRDLRDPESELILSTQLGLLEWIAEHSNRPAYYPVGDVLHAVKRFFGIPDTTRSAKLRAILNTLLPRPR